jgi:hypothetical protein
MNSIPDPVREEGSLMDLDIRACQDRGYVEQSHEAS